MDALMGLFWLLAAWLGGADDPECLLLGGLDMVRTEAFVTGEAARLRDVYADERAARADAEVLRSYRERGLRLDGMVLVRESCRVTSRSRRQVTLHVVDRLGPPRSRQPMVVVVTCRATVPPDESSCSNASVTCGGSPPPGLSEGRPG